MGDSTITLGETEIPPGVRVDTEIPVARLPTGTWLSLPVAVLNGVRPGPRVWIDAAIHGDEVNGLEIIRQVLPKIDPARLGGALFAVPMVNVFGFIHQIRYLPDRRDLNRCFPGSPRGSLAARLAHLFMREIVARCEYGIDLHTGSLHRTNLPQVRADLTDPETRRMAVAFGAPLVYGAKGIRGSLRNAARRRGVHVLVYEGGEPLRFDEETIAVGVRGILRMLAALGMWDGPLAELPEPVEAVEARWLRASRSGIFHLEASLGERVKRNRIVGRISESLSSRERPVKASFDGVIIGFTNNPLVYRGDALVHLARIAG